jgi:hypothetical protein
MITIKLIIPAWPNYERAAQSCLRESLDMLSKTDTGNFKIIIVKSVNCILATARNNALTNSCKKLQAVTDCDYCLFVDGDTGFVFNNIVQLFDLNFQVVGGGYKYREGPNAGRFVAGYWKPELPGAIESCVDKDESGIVKVDWTGGGFLLVRADVFSLIEYPWFRDGVIDNGDEAFSSSEDMGFCMQLKQVGIPILCHCGLNLIHKQD